MNSPTWKPGDGYPDSPEHGAALFLYGRPDLGANSIMYGCSFKVAGEDYVHVALLDKPLTPALLAAVFAEMNGAMRRVQHAT